MSGAILAGVGTAVSAGTALAGAAMGGGGGGDPSYQMAYDDYQRKVTEWKAFWDTRIPRMTKNQKILFKQTSDMLAKYKTKFADAYKEQNQEKIHREFVSEVNQLSKDVYTKFSDLSSNTYKELKNLTDATYGEIKGDIETLGKGTLDPKFKQRVTEAEHELNRTAADHLNDYVERNARERAKGGAGFINAERSDEMIAGNMARSRDMASGEARKQVEDTLTAMLAACRT